MDHQRYINKIHTLFFGPLPALITAYIYHSILSIIERLPEYCRTWSVRGWKSQSSGSFAHLILSVLLLTSSFSQLFQDHFFIAVSVELFLSLNDRNMAFLWRLAHQHSSLYCPFPHAASVPSIYSFQRFFGPICQLRQQWMDSCAASLISTFYFIWQHVLGTWVVLIILCSVTIFVPGLH